MAHTTYIKPRILSVAENLQYYFNSLLTKTMQMFEWEGFPDTVNIDYLNILLLTEGTACIIRDNNNELRCFMGNAGGKSDIYYRPTIYTIANPIFSKTATIGKECAVCCNSSVDYWGNSGGLYQLLITTAQMLADNATSLNIIQKNARLSPIITADTPTVKQSVDIVLNDMYLGKPYHCVDTSLIDEVKVNYLVNSNTGNDSITKLIELQQYIIANFYHAIGINSNYNLKRERLISDEIEINNDCLQVNISNMLKCRQDFCEEVNRLFNLNCSVKLGKEWDVNYNGDNNKSESEPVDITGLEK